MLAKIKELGQPAQRVTMELNPPCHAYAASPNANKELSKQGIELCAYMPMGSMMGLRLLAVFMADGTSRLLWRMSSSTPARDV